MGREPCAPSRSSNASRVQSVKGGLRAHRANCAGQKHLGTPCAKTPRATDPGTRKEMSLMGFKDIVEGVGRCIGAL